MRELSDAWYSGFLHWYDAILTLNGSAVKDVKRNSWVTRENFENMYENVYKRMFTKMVESSIAEKDEIEIQYEKRLPSKIQTYLVFSVP